MAIQPITFNPQGAGQQETIFNRTRNYMADTDINTSVFKRRADTYTVNLQNDAYDTNEVRRNNERLTYQPTTKNNTSPDRNAELITSIQRNAGLYLNAGPRQIAEQSLFTSQTQSTNILTNLTNTFGFLFNSQTTSARQSINNSISNFASLYSSAGTRLLNAGSLFSNSSVFSNSSNQAATITPQISYLNSIQSYLSANLSYNILGGGLNLFA